MCNGAPRKDACRMTRPGHRGASQLPLFIYGRAMEPFLSTRGALFFYFFLNYFIFGFIAVAFWHAMTAATTTMNDLAASMCRVYVHLRKYTSNAAVAVVPARRAPPTAGPRERERETKKRGHDAYETGPTIRHADLFYVRRAHL